MSLPSGTRLGPYVIQSAIGAGGMGEVYRARDTRLDRSVAIKILPPEVSADPDRRARFEREAKAIAGLSHPHICTLHDVGEHDGSMYLVMELLAGETLAARLEKGPLALEQALTVATEIADALATAHRQGAIHRDLKPANVMLTKSGAKLLDFGLAKLKGHGDEPAAAQVASMPTRSVPLTAEGTIVGTLQYMAPEQVEGRPADARTDLWALGAILYEMLAGKPPFQGASAASLITAIMASEPPALATLQPLTPAALDRLVRQCLAKAPDDRPDTAHDVANTLRWTLDWGPAGPAGTVTGRPPRGRNAVPASRWVAAGVTLAFAAAAGYLWWPRPLPTGRPPVVRSSLTLPATSGLTAPEDVAISPDGSTVVFRASDGRQSRLYVRRIDEWEAKPLEGTENANGVCFSPEGDAIAFMSPKGLYRLKLTGGPPGGPAEVFEDQGQLGYNYGMEWGLDGNIVFGRATRTRGIWIVPAKGGVPRALLDTQEVMSSPRRLPGTDALLFTRLRPEGGTTVEVLRPGKGKPQTLIPAGGHARYLPAVGQLVYEAHGHLLAVSFDVDRLRLIGEPYPVEAGVGSSEVTSGDYDVSQNGTVVYLSPPTAGLAWKTRNGDVKRLERTLAGRFVYVALFPDGRRAIVTRHNDGRQQLFVADLEGEAAFTPVAKAGDTAWFGVFSPDGRRLLYTLAGKGNPGNVYSIDLLDASGEPVRQTTSLARHRATSIGPGVSGRTFLYTVEDASLDVWQQELDRPSTARALLNSSKNELEAAFSPDGQWITYQSDAGGSFEIYVQRYPNGFPQVVSTGGGERPIWSRSGDEIFYQRSTKVFGVRVVNGARAGSPIPLFDRPEDRNRNWDVAKDGRFLVADTIRPSHINLITNWYEELKAKVPVR